jgi:hypothetical protein
VGVKNLPSIGVEQFLAAAQSRSRFLGQRRTVKIELPNLVEPALELLEVGLLLFVSLPF